MINFKIHKNGNMMWYNGNKHHRDNDLPAIIYTDGTLAWFRYGKMHRDNKPAYIAGENILFWYYNGIVHTMDNNPNIDYANISWYKNGKLCRKYFPFSINILTGIEEWKF